MTNLTSVLCVVWERFSYSKSSKLPSLTPAPSSCRKAVCSTPSYLHLLAGPVIVSLFWAFLLCFSFILGFVALLKTCPLQSQSVRQSAVVLQHPSKSRGYGQSVAPLLLCWMDFEVCRQNLIWKQHFHPVQAPGGVFQKVPVSPSLCLVMIRKRKFLKCFSGLIIYLKVKSCKA